MSKGYLFFISDAVHAHRCASDAHRCASAKIGLWPTLERTPWIAIDYGTRVIVETVEIFNRLSCCGDQTRNVDVRISDELPTSGNEMYSGGTLLGHFAGPATNGQHIIIEGQQML